jgi:hypothetical protein
VTNLSELFIQITLWAGSVHGYVRSTWLMALDPWIARTLGDEPGRASRDRIRPPHSCG